MRVLMQTKIGNMQFRNANVFKYCTTIIFLGIFLMLVSGKRDLDKIVDSKIEYVVSMENPNQHYFNVSCTYSGIDYKRVEFKLPVWTPGYYIIMDYPKYVVSFKAVDRGGGPLVWKKTSKDTWEISCGKTDIIRISYDVFAFRTSVADSFLDDGRGFISPTGIFMYPAGKKDHPVYVTIIPYEKFTRISTGLDPVHGIKNTFYAPDFDVLYDCPILAGNQEILTFEVDGIPYTIAAENLGNVDRTRLIDDHKKIIKASTSIIGEIPYKHYTFIVMNNGRGGLEHTNSMAVFSNPSGFNTPEGYKRWLDFIAHEFFHLYNVKTIRPIALGPVDYGKENYTTMLWFAEGVTSYYENLILNRAGIYTRNEFLNEQRTSISNYENIPGHLFQSVAEASFDAWMLFFNRAENAANTTISYYDKGCAIGMLLDLKIRYESGNQLSLDDVMRTLYQEYYKKQKRGYTDTEFREVCEKTAGSSLSEIFDIYIPTVQDIDYSKYLGYAGLTIDTNPIEVAGGWLGIDTRKDGDNLIITRTEWNSPAYNAGLSPQDIIRGIDGGQASSERMNTILNTRKPGDKISITVTHREITNNIEVVLGKKSIKSFEIKPLENPTLQQKAILDKWLK